MNTNFYQRMALVCERIPRGQVATYGQIALLCGKPKNARQVGYGLNRGLGGTKLPAHRVVNHQGVLSGAQAFEKADTQRKRLRAEGVQVSREQRVDLEKYGWKHTLEDALELRKLFQEQGL